MTESQIQNRILHMQNRIDLMRGRGRENGNIIKKLEREIRNLSKLL